MIVSFHPVIEGDQNILCAGRAPDTTDLAAIQSAGAVLLPQGCPEALYRMARTHCAHVFPNLDTRFDYPGKRGQIRLFQELGVAHPPTASYADVAAFQQSRPALNWPAVIKYDWGGQGETVFKITNDQELAQILNRATAFEASGQKGFLIQQFIPTKNRSLRVARIGTRVISYWRIQSVTAQFGTSVTYGARIDHDANPALKAAGEAVVQTFCVRTGLQLAGFDFIFDNRSLAQERVEPLLLEINYFFGRTGLGGSEAYYRLLIEEVDRWLSRLGLSRPGKRLKSGGRVEAG